MSTLLETLTFNALQQKSILSNRCANHELLDLVKSKWSIPEKDTISTVGTCAGIDNCVHLKTFEDGSSPDRLVFDGRDRYDTTLFRDLGSPLCLYRLGCTFPSAVYVEHSGKSAWWSVLTHKATGKFFGFNDFKGGVSLRIRSDEVFLSQYTRKQGYFKSFWHTMEG
ncbi:hypothetical protein BGX29_005279, partial [Mortierella sp. GBA35]